jgi:hypothetical protein
VVVLLSALPQDAINIEIQAVPKQMNTKVLMAAGFFEFLFFIAIPENKLSKNRLMVLEISPRIAVNTDANP